MWNWVVKINKDDDDNDDDDEKNSDSVNKNIDLYILKHPDWTYI